MKSLISLILTCCCLLAACEQKRETLKYSLTSPSNQAVAVPKATPTPMKSNTAIVISPHANLRESNSVRANVLEVVPVDSSVEVVKQQGAWFYVNTETVSGWMHGNTLKLRNFEINSSTPAPRVVRQPTPEPAIEESTNNSGATAKCRDGSLSYSAHRRGTCSHHGGVAVWY